MATHDLKRIYNQYSEHLKDEFTRILGSVSHPGEKGRAREQALAGHLRRVLPQRYDIGTGFVIDAEGAISKQIDLIIYDRIASPVFNIGGELNYYPAECVVAVGEVKSTISDNGRLTEALGKIKSVKKLHRFAGRERFSDGIHAAHGEIARVIPEDGILPLRYRTFGFIFTSESMESQSVRDGILTHCRASPPQLRFNMYVDFERFLISHQLPEDQGGGLTLYPEDADRIYLTKPEEKDTVIVLFTALLHRHLMNARVQEPDLLTYFKIRSTEEDSFEIET